MNNVIELSQFKPDSLRGELKRFYKKIDALSIDSFELPDLRIKLYQKLRGEFLIIFRTKKKMSQEEIAARLLLSPEEFSAIELGLKQINDGMFFRLCGLLGASAEVSVFLEKIEKAFNPTLRSARKNIAETLKIYGIRFADSDDYKKQ